jgi:hypothetical protein
MALIESTAAVLLRFTGLGMVCFNQLRRRGEIAVIRNDKHELSVKIQQPLFKDGIERDIIVYEDIVVYESLPKKGVEIEINATRGAAVAGYEIYEADEEFDRLKQGDPNDFRWIVKMDKLHPERLIKSVNQKRHPISKLLIGNGLFYAHQLDTNLFFEKIEKNASGVETGREDFGYVAETIGVKIDADEVGFNIKIGDRTHSQKLERRRGLPYRIEISNMNFEQNTIFSDMPDYYRYLSSPSGVTYELMPQRETSAAISGSMFCHPVEGGDCAPIDEFET